MKPTFFLHSAHVQRIQYPNFCFLYTSRSENAADCLTGPQTYCPDDLRHQKALALSTQMLAKNDNQRLLFRDLNCLRKSNPRPMHGDCQRHKQGKQHVSWLWSADLRGVKESIQQVFAFSGKFIKGCIWAWRCVLGKGEQRQIHPAVRRKHEAKQQYKSAKKSAQASITYITKLNILAVLTLATTTWCARANFRRFNPRVQATAGFLIATWSPGQGFGRWEAVKVLPACIKPRWEILAVVFDTLAKHGKAKNNLRGGEPMNQVTKVKKRKHGTQCKSMQIYHMYSSLFQIWQTSWSWNAW